MPDDEAGRLDALRRYRILDTEREEAFDDLARLASHVCAAPLSGVELVDANRGWLKAGIGFPLQEIRRDVSFSAHAIMGSGLMTVRDTWNDHRFADSPLVIDEPYVRFYAGAPLVTSDGHAIGALWVMDRIPRSLSPDQAAGLTALCRQTMTQMELSRNLAELRRTVALQEQAEHAVQERDQRLHLVVDQMPAVLWSTDRDLRFTSSLGAGLTALGMEPNQIVGMTLQEYLGSEDPEYAPIVAHRRALEGESGAYEQNWQNRRLESHVMPLRDADGKIAGALGVALDVTERMWAEGALYETEAKYRGLIETVPAVTYIDPIDEWNDSLYVSPQITDLLGCSPEQWLTDPSFWRKHVHPDDVDRVWEEYARSRDAGLPYHNEYRMIREDTGETVWVSERAVILRDPEGRPWAVQGVMVDITERKRVEVELEGAWQRERETAEHLRALDELKNLQLHAVSHDLRGPITAILGSALSLEHSDKALTPDKRTELVHGITAAGRKLHRLVADLLDLDRLERGILEPDRKATDVAALARGVVAEVDLGDHPVHVDGTALDALVDPAQVERILENLVLNAAKHTPAGTSIWIRLEDAEEGILLTVEDEGPGVPEELRRTIFEPFRQGGPGPGLGIGLSLVARFAELHGGWARVEDREGGGASFRVYLQDGRTSWKRLQDLAGRAT